MKTQSILWVLGYLTAVALTLVPSPLLEFRYFIVPYFFFRIHTISIDKDKQRPPYIILLICEAAMYLVFNVATFWLFLYRPFEWDHDPGVVQRFMY